jgi:hypothetical protein
MVIVPYMVNSFKFILKVGVEESIVDALPLWITDQLFKFYVFTQVVHSQSTLQGQL